ncbi:MAG: hypothetical protein AABX65_03820 [Nanoarchaeota archaeon]
MKIEDHLKRLKESLSVIEESIEKGIVERQRNIGFNASAGAMDILEILLHKNHLVDPGFILKHQWFRSKNKLSEKLPFDFPKKKEILELIVKIEEKRDVLCYGKPQPAEIVAEVIEVLSKLKKEVKGAGVDEI